MLQLNLGSFQWSSYSASGGKKRTFFFSLCFHFFPSHNLLFKMFSVSFCLFICLFFTCFSQFLYAFFFSCSFPYLIDCISTLAQMQDLLKLEKLREVYVEHYGNQPTFAQWADAADVDQKILSKRLKYGIQCREKMIVSNMRLVVSIAKKFCGVGMDIQDLVLVCSHMIGDFSAR